MNLQGFKKYQQLYYLKFKVAIKSLWMGLNLKESIDQRRIHHQLYPENGEYEIGFPQVISEFF